MDEELRKAQRIFERAGIPVPNNHQQIIQSAIQLMQADTGGNLEFTYWTEHHRCNIILEYLEKNNINRAMEQLPVLTSGLKYYLGLSKLIWEIGRKTLSENTTPSPPGS